VTQVLGGDPLGLHEVGGVGMGLQPIYYGPVSNPPEEVAHLSLSLPWLPELNVIFYQGVTDLPDLI